MGSDSSKERGSASSHSGGDSSYHGGYSTNTITPLMCLSIAEVLPHPMHHAYLRSAGRTGLRIYEELILLRKIPCCLEHPKSTEPPSAARPQEDYDHPTRQPWEELDKPSSKKVSPPPPTQRIPIFVAAILGISKIRNVQEDSTLVIFPDAAWRSNSPVSNTLSGILLRIPSLKCVRYCHDAAAEKPSDFMVKIPITKLLVVEGFDRCTSIGDQFRTFTMEAIDFTPLRRATRLTTLSDRFMFECEIIRHVDMTPLVNITTIGDHFMESCEKLESVNFSTLSKVTTIGESFLAFTPNLRTIEFGPAVSFGKAGGMGTNITEVGEWFCRGATSLEKLDLKTFTKIKIVGDFFLSKCTSLRYVDLRPFGNDVKSVGVGLLHGCGDITVDHPPRLGNVAPGCKKLKESRDGRYTM